MRIRAMMLALGATAALGMSASGAAAATLFTTSAHTTPVATGSAFSVAATSPFVLTSATSALNTCSSSTLSGTITSNGTTTGTVVGSITSGTLAGCTPFSFQVTFPSAWALTVPGAAETAGDTTTWTNSQLHNFRFTANNGPYSGTLAGLRAAETKGAGPICIQFADAGTITGPLTGNGRVDTNYCFTGASASYSLG